ncbi:hypothetical protein CDD83_4741 [Cordyceps sp. RAO-2017]|nr:hypothetical protein CDD83_4741 [Cordyceps sp. RAO-2017]
MLFKPLAFAAAAAAFVIVPEITEAEVEEMFNILPIAPPTAEGLAGSAVAHQIDVPCPQCKGENSHLELVFTVEDRSRLMLNGFELYPTADPWSDLMAGLVQANGNRKSKRLGYSLAVGPMPAAAGTPLAEAAERVNIDLKVIEVGRQFVERLPTVKVQIKDSKEGIVIEKIKVQEESEAPCSGMMCRAKDLAGEMLKSFNKLKGCVMKHKNHTHRPHHPHHGQQDAGVVPVHGDRPEQAAEEHQQPRHDWRQLLKNIASHIFLPVLMGVTAGVGVAILAMVLCSVAIRLTRLVKSKRSQRAGCCRRKHASRQQPLEVEKVGLMEEQADSEEQPPQYQDDESKN